MQVIKCKYKNATKNNKQEIKMKQHIWKLRENKFWKKIGVKCKKTMVYLVEQ